VSPIAAYLDELSRLLVRRGRRRVLVEVHMHLLDAAAARSALGEDAEVAQRQAVARFGAPREVARQFNAVARRSRRLVRRIGAVALACVASASLGTASVWAFEPSHPAGAAHHAQGTARVIPRSRRHR
jgi:hypothetical protein